MADQSRQRVVRADGRTISVVQRRAHLSYCFTGCCCGKTEHGYAAVPADTFTAEWRRRKLRSVVHLTKAGCLGPSTLANLVRLVFDSRAVWFHSVNTPWHVRLIFDYIETMITEEAAVVLLTDGRANVPSRTADPWADALDAAAAITCPVLVIDSETGPHPSGRARQLADRMHGTHFALDALDEVRLVDLVRPMAERAIAQP